MNSVVIVDDSESTLRLYEKVIMRLRDAHIVPFTSSSAAIDWLRTNDAALIVTDQQMPAPDGLEFVRLVHLIPGRGDVPIIMVTSRTDPATRVEALRRGVSGFLNKPVDPMEFLAIAQHLLDQVSVRRTLTAQTVELARRLESSNAEIVEHDLRAVRRLRAVTALVDPDLMQRGERVTGLAVRLARRLGLGNGEVALLETVGPLFDLGRLRLPRALWVIPQRYDPDQLIEAQAHATFGAELLADSHSVVFGTAATIARSHHEWYDGTGYPDRLRGEMIPLLARVIGLCDAYLAMQEPRPHRSAMTPGHAFTEIERRKALQFDPLAVDALHEIAISAPV